MHVLLRRLPIRTLLLALLTLSPGIGGAQAPFKSSLTATVIIQPPVGARKDAPRGGMTDLLACRRITLRWGELTAAKRYAVYVASRADGPWTALPAANLCGKVEWTGATLVRDTEPTAGGASVVRRLYYKVFALAGDTLGAPTLAVTDVVMVELP